MLKCAAKLCKEQLTLQKNPIELEHRLRKYAAELSIQPSHPRSPPPRNHAKGLGGGARKT